MINTTGLTHPALDKITRITPTMNGWLSSPDLCIPSGRSPGSGSMNVRGGRRRGSGFQMSRSTHCGMKARYGVQRGWPGCRRSRCGSAWDELLVCRLRRGGGGVAGRCAGRVRVRRGRRMPYSAEALPGAWDGLGGWPPSTATTIRLATSVTSRSSRSGAGPGPSPGGMAASPREAMLLAPAGRLCGIGGRGRRLC